MRQVMLVSVLFLSLVALQALVPDSHLYAKHRLWHCCTPGMCDSGCYCCWQTPYCTCVVADDEAMDAHHHADEGTINVRRLHKPRAFNIANTNITERLRTLMAGMRSDGNFALRVLRDFEKGLKIWCPESHEANRSDNVVALQMHDHTGD